MCFMAGTLKSFVWQNMFWVKWVKFRRWLCLLFKSSSVIISAHGRWVCVCIYEVHYTIHVWPASDLYVSVSLYFYSCFMVKPKNNSGFNWAHAHSISVTLQTEYFTDMDFFTQTDLSAQYTLSLQFYHFYSSETGSTCHFICFCFSLLTSLDQLFASLFLNSLSHTNGLSFHFLYRFSHIQYIYMHVKTSILHRVMGISGIISNRANTAIKFEIDRLINQF